MKVSHIEDTQILERPVFRTGATVKVHQKIREGGKERIQIFEGLVIARKAGSAVNASFTVRKIASGVGVERVYPLHSPNITKIEVVKQPVVTKAKLYYVRKLKDNAPRIKKNQTAK